MMLTKVAKVAVVGTLVVGVVTPTFAQSTNDYFAGTLEGHQMEALQAEQHLALHKVKNAPEAQYEAVEATVEEVAPKAKAPIVEEAEAVEHDNTVVEEEGHAYTVEFCPNCTWEHREDGDYLIDYCDECEAYWNQYLEPLEPENICLNCELDVNECTCLDIVEEEEICCQECGHEVCECVTPFYNAHGNVLYYTTADGQDLCAQCGTDFWTCNCYTIGSDICTDCGYQTWYCECETQDNVHHVEGNDYPEPIVEDAVEQQ